MSDATDSAPDGTLSPAERLDVLESEGVVSVEEIAAQGKTILLVEQNAAAAINLADYCYVLDQGRIVYQGASADLRSNDEVRQEYLGV